MRKMVFLHYKDRSNLRSKILCVFTFILIDTAILQTGFSQPFPITQSVPRNLDQLKPPSVKFTQGPVIPGLRQKAVPQGITYANDLQKIIISHYFDNAPSCLTVLNRSTGKMRSCVKLKEESGKLHRGHVGGITVQKDSLFVASDGDVLQYQLSPLLSSNPPVSLPLIANRKCETEASFCTATNEMLFVGEFAYGKKYPTKASHHIKDRKGIQKYAWVCGYDSTTPLGPPKCVLSIRQRVQGMCVTHDRIYLSVSYGRRNRSKIVFYNNPIEKVAHAKVKIQNGNSVPL